MRGLSFLFQVQKAYCSIVANGPQEVDIVAWNTRVALELVAQAGLDYTFDTLEVNSKPHPYAVAAKELAYVSLNLINKASLKRCLQASGNRFLDPTRSKSRTTHYTTSWTAQVP